jgi:competence protein ComEC
MFDQLRWRLKRRVHMSWLVAVLSAGVVMGVILAQDFSEWFGSVSWLLIGLSLAIISFWRRYIYFLVIVLVAGGLIGLWRGSIDQQQLQPYKKIIGYQAMVQGTVSEDADLGKQGELVLRLNNLQVDGHELIGKIWASGNTKFDIKRGDQVTIRGKLSAGFGSFAASMYRADIERVQRPIPGDVARQVRDEFAGNVRQAIPDPEAALGIGYLVGQRRALPPELDEALKIAGLTHIVVASGYNLTILVRLARRLFVKISRYIALVASGGLVLSFVAVTGASPSMSRAGLVAGLSLLAWYYGRKFHPLVLLPFAAAVTLLVDPSYGWNDLGWQLSFAAFAGVMILAPLLQAYFFDNKKPGTIRQILGETVSAQILTLPILVLAFGTFSNVAIIANLLVLPLVPLAMLLTFLAGIGALLFPFAAEIIGMPATVLLQYMTGVAEYVAKLPWAQTVLEIPAFVAAIFYMVLVVACVYMWQKTKYNLRDANLVE